MDKRIKKRLDEELDDHQKAELQRLGSGNILKLTILSTKLYNEACHACKQTIIRHAKTFTQDMFCAYCQKSDKIRGILTDLENLQRTTQE